ncbi:uncharacterized protein C12orf45 homolog isoform X2 [Stegostoma tigrinum]|uniref:uncharacterized protein C12orf45 homolog isoform X2 n=1 Tax=Stegostoma tigrinum TaxID=3053191 RepID=UPI002870764A|nr:uncharacterized protein C12orf45 homolog isoform X2 [Stegostoma tigrinum]
MFYIISPLHSGLFPHSGLGYFPAPLQVISPLHSGLFLQSGPGYFRAPLRVISPLHSGLFLRSGPGSIRAPLRVIIRAPRRVLWVSRLVMMAAGGNGLSPNRSKDLLRAESGLGFRQSLVVDPAHSRSLTRPQIVRVGRSSVLDRLQNFLPQMARANQELLKQMEISKPGHFDIENIEDCPDKVIEMADDH